MAIVTPRYLSSFVQERVMWCETWYACNWFQKFRLWAQKKVLYLPIRVLRINSSNFCSWRSILFLLDHNIIDPRSFCSTSWPIFQDICRDTLWPPAKYIVSDPQTTVSRSFMNTMKRTGPSRQPWDTTHNQLLYPPCSINQCTLSSTRQKWLPLCDHRRIYADNLFILSISTLQLMSGFDT